VLQGVSLDAEPGAVTMILGMSGSGKTTLLRIAKGLLPAQRGSVQVLGRQVAAEPGRGRLDPRVAYIPQQLGLVRSITALENTLVGALSRVGRVHSLFKAFPADEVREARDLLDRLGIGHKAHDKVFALSGGERQRVAIARALLQHPRVLLADEFISDLDPLTSAEIMTIVREIADSGVGILMTTHELDVVARHADHVVVLREGRAVYESHAEPDVVAITRALRR
jgi:phosphonate transport system ATP-binding protein